MKITNYILVNILNTLQNYSTKKLPQRISYAITRNLMQVSKEYEVYDTQLKNIFKNYSDYIIKDESGNMKISENGIPVVVDSKKDEFGEQIADLLNIELEINMYYIDENIFDYEDNGVYDAMSAQDILILQSILCEHKEDK